MKVEVCAFSGFKIHPGKGVHYVPCVSVQSTRPVFSFINRKCVRFFVRKRNPRKVPWTQLFRRQHKKGTIEEVKKRRVRRAQKVVRGYAGLSIEQMLAKQKMTEEQRQAERLAVAKARAESSKKAAAQKEKKKLSEEAKQKAQAQKQAQKASQKAAARVSKAAQPKVTTKAPKGAIRR